ncbi:recombinase family protein [Mucilaginibacter corticis]|nr:recombinase family protein [Mucilaginibacter corticis]
MINTLKILGVEPQAIEQPLDMSVPENKMMLAIYLTAPEIENDRRALNTFYGMRRARKEGRWVSQAPIGYVNKHDERGKKYIGIDEEQGEIMKWAFEELSKGMFPSEQIFREAVKKGLNCKKNNFLYAIRNPVYCGRILIVKYKDEDAHTVKGQHEAIIPESLFYDVQDILDGKKRLMKVKIHSPDHLPLRGFIRCSKCSRTLCGSASKGRKSYYHYYHCSSACGCRYKAEEVNDVFTDELKNYCIDDRFSELFSKVIIDAYYSEHSSKRDNRSELLNEINALNDKVGKARELLLNGDIDAADYKAIKTMSEGRIIVLEAKLAELADNNQNQRRILDIEPLITGAIFTLTRLNVIFSQSNTCEKRELIGSMYPQKFTFEDIQHRTGFVNDLYSFIYLINSQLGDKKRRASDRKTCLPTLAPEAGLEPATL